MSTFARLDVAGGTPVFVRPESVLVVAQGVDQKTGQAVLGQSMLVVAGLPGPLAVMSSPARVVECLKHADMGLDTPPASGTIPRLAEH